MCGLVLRVRTLRVYPRACGRRLNDRCADQADSNRSPGGDRSAETTRQVPGCALVHCAGHYPSELVLWTAQRSTMLQQPRVVLLVSALMFLLALEVSAASRSKEEMLRDLVRKRTSARQPRLVAPDLPALRQQALGVLDNHATVMADRVAGALGSFNRRAMVVHERVSATAALRENTRESVKERAGALNTTRQGRQGGASPARHASVQHVLGRELLQIDLFVPPPP